MRQATLTKQISKRELSLLDLVTTGDGALMAGCDRRTFIAHAKNMGIEPVAELKGGKLVYKRDDAERIAKSYRQKQKDNPR